MKLCWLARIIIIIIIGPIRTQGIGNTRAAVWVLHQNPNGPKHLYGDIAPNCNVVPTIDTLFLPCRYPGPGPLLELRCEVATRSESSRVPPQWLRLRCQGKLLKTFYIPVFCYIYIYIYIYIYVYRYFFYCIVDYLLIYYFQL